MYSRPCKFDYQGNSAAYNLAVSKHRREHVNYAMQLLPLLAGIIAEHEVELLNGETT